MTTRRPSASRPRGARGRSGIQADYVVRRENWGYDEHLEGVEIRKIEFFTVGAVYHLGSSGRFRPHVFAGGEFLRDTTNTCTLIRRRGGDCQNFPHRRPGLNAGLGLDVRLGGRWFARVQYMTSAVFVYEQVGVGHRLRVGAGVSF